MSDGEADRCDGRWLWPMGATAADGELVGAGARSVGHGNGALVALDDGSAPWPGCREFVGSCDAGPPMPFGVGRRRSLTIVDVGRELAIECIPTKTDDSAEPWGPRLGAYEADVDG